MSRVDVETAHGSGLASDHIPLNRIGAGRPIRAKDLSECAAIIFMPLQWRDPHIMEQGNRKSRTHGTSWGIDAASMRNVPVNMPGDAGIAAGRP